MEKIVVDARGRSCPEPVLMTKKAMAQTASRYEILVDNDTALQNVSRFVRNAGLEPQVSEQGEDYLITVERK